MVKFVEQLEYVGFISDMNTCTCCKQQKKGVTVYKTETQLVLLCEQCRIFIEELLE